MEDRSNLLHSTDESEEGKLDNNVLKAAIESSVDGICINDGTGKILLVNQSAGKHIGVPPKELIGKNVQDMVSTGVFDKVVTFEVIRSKKRVSILQRTKIGKTILVTGTPIFGDNGEISHVVTNDRDITELNKVKEQLNDMHALTRHYHSELSNLQFRNFNMEGVIANSKEFRTIIDAALRVAKVNSTALITGESGVGKNLIAKIIHKNSNRTNGPFIRINCSAIPDSLMESELFGYESGAFTGAKSEGKPGIFELANKGTLFLDEIGEISASTQVKLLHALEENEMMRVGGTKSIKIDVRVIAATNKNLEKEILERLFREDLFFRLNVLPIKIPPLRERKEDISPLSLFFLNKFKNRHKINRRLSSEALDVLYQYSFPGNVRELANLIERILILTNNSVIEVEDLPKKVIEDVGFQSFSQASIKNDGKLMSLKEAMEKCEAKIIKDALLKSETQEVAAIMLGINQSTIARKAKKYGITRSVFYQHNSGGKRLNQDK
jgi:PAS domain S-box-containing protein